MVTIYLGLGCNLGDREAQLRAAIVALGQEGVTVQRSASVYLTEPRYLLDQPWFLNTVIEAVTEHAPQRLLQICLEIERRAGRTREAPNAPRPLDIDILFYGTEIIDTPDLIVPHPRYFERNFVLEPLAELAPDLRDPVRNRTVRELLEHCPDRGSVRVHAPPLL